MFDKYRDFESFDIYSTRAYYDQPVKVTATFSGKMLFSILPIGSDAVGKKVKINLRMVTNRVLGQASPLKEVVIGEEGATGMLEIPYDKTALVGYLEKGQNTTVTIRVEFTFDSDVPAGSCKIGFSEEMTCNIHFGNQDGSQDRFYYKYASVTDAVFSMRTGTYTGTEFKINKNGIIPLYGEVNGDTGETEEDVSMFNKGARYKISCYRTDSDNAKLPLYTDGKSPSIAAGTEFVILNIVMPESYVTMAENTLEKAALDYLSRYDHENRTVSLDISSGFVAEHPNLFIDFIEGNMLKVRDDGIGVFDFSDNGQIVDMQLQIQSLEIKYSKENMFPSYSCTIARRKILSFYERLAQENQTTSTQNTTNVTLGGSGTGSGTNIFSEQLLNDLIASFQKFNGWFEWDEVNQALRCKSAFYTNQWISALGAQSGSGEPGGGEGGLIKVVYGFADLGKTFDDSNLSNTFNAYTINEIWKLAKEGGMNTDKLWQELGKDDPTKKIHISHLPDNKFVTLDTEQTVTASKIFTGQLSTANVVPSVNNASTLGLESKRWENIYAVDANISGTVKTQALQVGDIKIIYDSVNKAVTFEHIDGSTEIGFYTRGWISALGVSPGGSGGSGGDGLVKNVYGFSNLGTTCSDSDLDNTFNAYTINEIWKMAKEGGGIKNITQSGSGNAVTDMALSSDGKTITAVFGETFARQQDLGTLNNTVTQLSNKLNNFLEGSDADNIINKWKELEAFLDGLTESDNLAELLALKADKTITISAGTGLTGGGNLSANRTLSLATTGVKAGTYTKVTVDTYGRVTVGDNPTTLAGYGITDAVTLTTNQTISGQKTFTKNILMNSGIGLSYGGNIVFRNTAGNTVISSYGNEGMIYFRPNGDTSDVGVIQINKQGHLNGVSAGFTGGGSAARLTANEYIQIGDAQLVYDSANKALRVKHRADGNTVGFYSDGWVSALGVKTGGSGGGSGVVNTVYSFANLTDGTTFSDSDLDNTFNAYTIKKLYDMAGQGGLDADAMWAELKKADSSKIIDASHIPTSVLDGRWVTLSTNQTITGQKTFTQQLKSTVATGVSPLIVSSNTLVNNLNSNYLEGYNNLGFIHSNYSASTGGTAYVSGDTHIMLVAEINIDTTFSTYVILLSNEFWGHQHYSALQLHIACTNNDNSGNKSPRCSVHVMSLVGSHARGVRYKIENNKAYIFIEVWGGNSYGRWASTILQNYDSITTNNANTTGNIKLRFAFNQANSGLTAASYDNYINAASLAASRTLWGQPFNGTANVSGNMTGVGSINMSGQLTSTVASGVAPFIVSSNTVVGNLNADMVDGLHLSDFDGRYVKKAGDNITGMLVMKASNIIYMEQSSDTSTQHIRFQGGSSDYGRIAFGATGSNAGWMEIASADDGNEPIYARQYMGVFTTIKNTLTLLDANGDTVMSNNKGLNVGWGSRQVRTSGVWVHGGGDAASSTDANLRFGSWYGIGWYPTIDSTSGVRQGNNAMWLNVRDGNLDTHGAITAHTNYLAANWDSARRLVLGGGSYAWIDLRNSSNNVLCNILLQDNKVVIGKYAESSRFVSTVGTGTQPYQCNSTTLNTNLNADMLDGYHQASFSMGWTTTTKYRVDRWGGNTDKNWKKIVTYVNTGGGTYQACKVKGTIYFITGNHNQGQVIDMPFEAIMYAYDGTANSMLNQSTLYLPPYCTWDMIRIVRYGNNSWEVQVRQPSDWSNISLEYTVIKSGGSVSAGQFTNTSYSSTVANNYNTNVSRPTSSRANIADRLTTGRSINGTNFDGSANITTSYWGSTRTFYIQDNSASHTGTGISVNGSGNVYLKLPNSIQCGDWFRSTGHSGWYHQEYGGGWYMTDSTYIRNFGGKRLRIQTDTYDTLQLVRTSGSGGSSIAFYNGGGTFRGQLGVNASSWFSFDTGTATANQNVVEISPAGGIHSKAEITAKASGSDIRLKKDIQNYNAMDIINKFRSVKYHWNDVAKANSEVYNNDYDQFGLIAQDLISGGFKQWVRDVFHDYYTVTYERLIPVVWKGLQEVDDEVTRLKKRVRELENKLGIKN